MLNYIQFLKLYNNNKNMFVINGGKELEGTITIGGSKNAVLPIIAATLLIKGKIVLKNIPKIGDVYTFLNILGGIGVKYTFDNNSLNLDSSNIKEVNFDLEQIKKIRASILLLPPLLSLFGKVEIPTPGGCNLGKRSISSHLKGLEKVGYNYKLKNDKIILKGDLKEGDLEINAGFGVTPTENLIMANVYRKGKTIIKSSAIEPHVLNLIDFLKESGAKITIKYDHTIVIKGVDELKKELDFTIISDYLQSGAYMIMGALISKKYLIIENARKKDLFSFIQKLKESGVKIEDLGEDKIKVYRSDNLKGVSIQTNIFPGFPTDLQSPFAILMTKAEGNSKIHEILFEGRLNWLVELEKMGGKIDILNPHEAIIFQRDLIGAEVTSWDLRAGAAMLIAGLIAKGKTTITNIDYIKRGYEDILENLQKLGADIREV